MKMADKDNEDGDFKRLAIERRQKALEALGLINSKLSRLTGVSEQTIGRFINDGTDPHPESFYKLCDALKKTPKYLAGITDPRPEEKIAYMLLQLSDEAKGKCFSFVAYLYAEEKKVQTIGKDSSVSLPPLKVVSAADDTDEDDED